MIKAIIFDCFGVLATEGWIPFRDKTFGHDSDKLRGANDLMQALSVGALSPDEFMERMSDLSGMSVEELKPVFYTNVPNEELFEWIRQRETLFKFAVLSNIASGRFEEIFSTTYREVFDALALSHSTGFAKPDPRAYELALDALNLSPEESVFVDDQEKNVTAAQAMGMYGIVYENQKQFEKSITKILELQNNNPEY